MCSMTAVLITEKKTRVGDNYTVEVRQKTESRARALI